MDIYKLKFTRLQNEIFRLLCVKSGGKMSQRQIAKILKVSPTAVAKSIKDLEKYDLIKIEKDKRLKLTYIELNRDSEKSISFKRVENLKMIYESELDVYLEGNFPGAAIILFGSFSRGDDRVESDIDIAIVGIKRKDLNLENFEKLLERKIIINFYSSFHEIEKHLRNNIFNGIILTGGVEL